MTRAQRIGIWIIVVFMAVGTIGSFVVIVLANKNQANDQAHLNAEIAQYQKDSTAYQAKVDAQAKQLSDKYFAAFNQYSTVPAPFDKVSVKSLQKDDLVVGTGDAITSSSSFTAYYIGWGPDGKVFDSSLNGNALKAPFTASPGGVIKGWTEGVDGMKVGSVRELTIPSDLAYGSTGSGSTIAPNTPLKFVLMIIPTPEAIPQPTMPQDLQNYYQTGKTQ